MSFDRVDLKNSEFADHLRPFFHEKTDHFMHELISFAKSPLDMVAYDSKVSYGFAQSHRDGPQTNSETADGETTLTNITGQHITYPPVPGTHTHTHTHTLNLHTRTYSQTHMQIMSMHVHVYSFKGLRPKNDIMCPLNSWTLAVCIFKFFFLFLF